MTRYLAALAIVPFVGCADSAPAPTPEEPTAGSAVEIGKADGDSSATLWTYFIVTRQDTRRCVSPLCGGVFIKRINQPQIKCVDGKWAKECYVGGFDFAAIGFSEEEAVEARSHITSGQAVFRGQMVTGYFEGDFASVAAFEATEVWTSPLETKPSGTFFQAEDAGIMCITSPCPSIDGWKLNKNANPYARYAGIDFTRTGASDDLIAKAWSALQVPSDIGGLIVAGKVVTVTGLGGSAQGLDVKQLYFPLLAATKVEGQPCGSRGHQPCAEGYFCQFNDQWCGAADGGGVCTLVPEVCTKEYAPVCGCDGRTYGNDCMRMSASVGFGTEGECETDNACEIGGCSGELCVPNGSDMVSMCLWQEEFVCYAQYGVCETQLEGGCGWSPTVALTTCLDGFGASQH